MWSTEKSCFLCVFLAVTNFHRPKLHLYPGQPGDMRREKWFRLVMAPIPGCATGVAEVGSSAVEAATAGIIGCVMHIVHVQCILESCLLGNAAIRFA